MNLLKSIKFWRIALFSAVGLSLILIIWLVRGVMLPFFLGLFLAYLFSPMVIALERRGIPAV